MCGRGGVAVGGVRGGRRGGVRAPAARAGFSSAATTGLWVRIGDSCEASGRDPFPILSLAVSTVLPRSVPAVWRPIRRAVRPSEVTPAVPSQSSPQNTTSSGGPPFATTISSSERESVTNLHGGRWTACGDSVDGAAGLVRWAVRGRRVGAFGSLPGDSIERVFYYSAAHKWGGAPTKTARGDPALPPARRRSRRLRSGVGRAAARQAGPRC